MSSEKATPRPQDVLAGLRALSTEIDALDHVAAELFGLSPTDMRALDIVGLAGPISPTDLAERMGFTTGGITAVLDRLERAGYVRRIPHPGDRRRLVVEKTKQTAKREREVFAGISRKTMDALGSYTDDELAVIQAFLDRMRELTADHAGELAQTQMKERSRRSRRAREGT
jgi:DNA-binding MarR family transcriptional regulator